MVALCRLCASLKKSTSLTFIRDNDNDLLIKLAKCCHLTVDLNNALPKGVCPECLRSLNASFEFYERVHESQQSLEKLFNVQTNSKASENETTSTADKDQIIDEERKSLALISASVSATPPVESPVPPKNDQVTTKPLETETSNDSPNNEDDDEDDIYVRQALKDILSGVKNDEEIGEPHESENEELPQKDTEEDIITSNDNEPTSSIEFIEDEATVFDFDSGQFEVIEVYEEEGNEDLRDETNMSNDEVEDESNHVIPNEVSEDERLQFSEPKLELIDNTWKDYSWQCFHCNESYTTAQGLVDHYEEIEQVAASDAEWICMDCLKTFPRYYTLINHIRQRHRPHLAKICDICDQSCDSFKALEDHRKSVHGDIGTFVMLLCTTCGKGFNNSNSLQIHSKCHLPDDQRMRFSCNLCDKKFRSSSNLKFHQKLHAGLRDFVCDQCGKKFIQKSNLEEHLVTHNPYTPFQCNICNKLFKTSERLLKHKTRHNDDKPFACTQCEKKFRTKDAYSTHMRIHTGEMPFKCEFCQKPFRFRSTLTTHHNVHTGVRPYSCDDCDHHFTNWPNYNKHMKRRHGIDVKSKNPRGKKPSELKVEPPTKTETKVYNIRYNSKVTKQTSKEAQYQCDDNVIEYEEVEEEVGEEDVGAAYEPEEDINSAEPKEVDPDDNSQDAI